MNFNNIKHHLIAIAIFVAVTIIFCYPVFKDMVLQSHDNMSWQYMSQESKAYHEKNGGAIYWSNSMFGGMPTYTTYGGDGYGNKLAWLIFSPNLAVPRPLFLMFLGFICFYILGNALRLNKWLSIIGAVAFGLSSYYPILAMAGHDTKMMAIALSASTIAGLIHLYNKKWWLGISVYTLSLTLLFASSHFQIVYYMLLLMAIVAVVLAIDAVKSNTLPNFLKMAGIIAICSVVAVLPNISGTMLTQGYSKHTIRGGQSELTQKSVEKKPNGGLDKDYAFSWSNGIGETFCILIPGLYGGSSTESYPNGEAYKAIANMAGEEQAENFASSLPLYWGPQPFLSGPIYFGAIICFLFVFSLFVIRSPHKWWVVAASLFFIILSVGKNFSSINYFLFDHMPMYNKFRTPSMALSIPMVLFPMMGLWGLHEILSNKIEKQRLLQYLKWSLAIVGGLVFLVGICSGMLFSFRGLDDDKILQQLGGAQAQGIMDAIISDRKSLAMMDGVRSLFFILVAAGAIWFYIKEKLSASMAMLIIGLACSVDLLGVSKRYLGEKDFTDSDKVEAAFAPRPVDQQILQDKDPYYRVQDFTINTYNDAKPSYFHKMVGGYHPAKLEMYQDLIESQMTPGAKNNKEVYNMLNTKYFIVPSQDGKAQVYPNPEKCGNAWFVSEIKMVPTADAEMAALDAPNVFEMDTVQRTSSFNPKQTAIVRETFKAMVSKTNFTKDSSSSIVLTQYGLNNLTYESNNSTDGFAVFSDIYYDGGWKAYVDGKETPIVRTNYVLRGLMLPAGKHRIEFKLYPTELKSTEPISIAGSYLVLLLFGAGIFMSFKKKELDGETETH